jgi:hypothetical protein
MRKSIILLLILTAGFRMAICQEETIQIKNYVQNFSESLTPIQKRMCMLHFADTARIQWNNLPVGLRARAGISMGSLSDEQRMIIHRILSASLSSQGYLKTTGIMHLDNLINIYYDTLFERKAFDEKTHQFLKDLKWSNKNYYFALFGNPQTDSVWGYKLEGHHLSLNFTFDNQHLSVTPMFVGTDPSEFLMTEYAGWRVLGQEEDLGLKLIQSMTPLQKQKAIKSTEVPGDIITAAESGIRLVDYWGIKGAELNIMQQSILKRLIREFVFNLEQEKADEEYDKIVKAGIGNIYFGWIGETEEIKPHYFILNGPTFIIEFDNNGGPRERANHIHAIWREKRNEYGEDILKKHYQAEKHL